MLQKPPRPPSPNMQKRRSTHHDAQQATIDMSPPPFAARVLPLGNLPPALDLAAHRRRQLGHLRTLSDTQLCTTLDALTRTLPPRAAASTLASLSTLSPHCHALATDDDLWRRLAFSLFAPSQIANAPFRHSWRATVTRLLSGAARVAAPAAAPPPVFSEVLFHKRRCLGAQIEPSWLCHHDVPRRSASDLSPEAFRAEYESARRPVILTGLVEGWAARDWTPERLSALCGDTEFNAGGHAFTLRDYFRYADAIAGHDDQPLYVFDPAFAQKAPRLAAHYAPPPHFGPDLFDVLGADRRPHFRWLIAGPPRSGSSFHVDPNATSAWNAALVGRKKWVLFPPGRPPPGVRPSADGADVAAPLSVLEWFVNFYDRAAIRAAGALECIAHPGDVVFVPRGWWHCVINLDVSVALTQNYCASQHVVAAVRWLRSRPKQISGCRSEDDAAFMRDNFARLVVDKYPHLRERLRFALKDERDGGDADVDMNGAAAQKETGLWQRLRTDDAAGGDAMTDAEAPSGKQPFSFGF